jgi:hypothetical protein
MNSKKILIKTLQSYFNKKIISVVQEIQKSLLKIILVSKS